MSVFIEDSIVVSRRKPKKKYFTKYKEKYKDEYPWALSSIKGSSFAFCELCKVDICIKSVGAKGLRDHESTCRHAQSTQQSLRSFDNHDQPAPQDLASASSHGANLRTQNPLQTQESQICPENASNNNITFAIHPLLSHDSSFFAKSVMKEESDAKLHASISFPVQLSRCRQGCSSMQDPGESAAAEVDDPSYPSLDPPLLDLKQSEINLDKSPPRRGELCMKEEIYVMAASSAPSADAAKEVQLQSSSAITPSLEDLTCNVCGLVFDSWKALKSDLEAHVRQIQVENKKPSTLRGNRKNEVEIIDVTKDAPRRGRGRPKGSTNKKNRSLNQSQDSNEKSTPMQRRISDRNEPNCGSVKTTNSEPSIEIIEDPLRTSADEAPVAPRLQQQSTAASRSAAASRVKGHISCRVCKARFTARKMLKHHMLTHNNGRPYNCNFCDKFFTTKSNLKVHETSKHSLDGENLCKCETCGKVLSTRTNLKIHLRIHKGERPFECPICSKKFSRKANMEMHMVYHSGERRFICEICGQSFFAINALKRHTKLHTGERNFACDVCGSTYITKTDLRRHVLKHQTIKPYPCHICEKQFTRAHDLKIHLRYHTKDIQFTCSECNMQFVESGNYRRHMRKHTGERPYMCTICMQTFTQVHHFKQHLKTHHPDELDSANQMGQPVYPKKNKVQKVAKSSQKTPAISKTIDAKDHSGINYSEEDLQEIVNPTLVTLNQGVINASIISAPPLRISNTPNSSMATPANISNMLTSVSVTSDSIPITQSLSSHVVQASQQHEPSESHQAAYLNHYHSYLSNSGVVTQYPAGIIEVTLPPQPQSSAHMGQRHS